MSSMKRSGSPDFDLERFYGGLLERFQSQHGVLEDIIARSEGMLSPPRGYGGSPSSRFGDSMNPREDTFKQAMATAKELKMELESLRVQTQQARAASGAPQPAEGSTMDHLSTLRESVTAAKELKAELENLKAHTIKASESVSDQFKSPRNHWQSPLGKMITTGKHGEEIRIFLSSLNLEGTFPSLPAIKELLYGDPGNSAQDADIVVLFMSSLSITSDNVQSLKKLLRRCLKDPEQYLFSEDLSGLGVEGIPCQLSKTDSDAENHAYIYMSVAVKVKLGHDADGDGQISLADTFPMPPALSCGAPSRGDKADEYRLSKSVMLQHLQVKSTFSQFPNKNVHILICGVNLDDDYEPQKKQLEALERQLRMLMYKGYPFTAVLVGDVGHSMALGEDLKSHIEEIKPKEDGKKKKGAKVESTFLLKDSGVEMLCKKMLDPASRRKLLFEDTLHFTGTDCFGNRQKPPPCSEHLVNLFDLHGDLFLDDKNEVPMPTAEHMSTMALWSEALGFTVAMPQVVTQEMNLKAVKALEVPQSSVKDLIDLYLPPQDPQDKAHARVLKPKLGKPLYIQGGWLDGIGVYKNGTCPATLTSWKTHDDIFSFDHVPVTGSVDIIPEAAKGGSRKTVADAKLRVWCGSIKLDNRFPTSEALKQLLYKTEGNSAHGADVIALFATDLEVTKKLVKKLQNLLYSSIDESERDKYIFNEQEAGLVLKSIPVQLMKMVKGKPRYIALFICVKREIMGVMMDGNMDGTAGDVDDVFPRPPELICRSDMKNESAPSFKGHMAQTVLITRNSGSDSDFLRLVLVGLNFDTADDVRDRQVDRLKQFLNTLHAQKHYFAAIIFGDFNNRLVCPQWLAPHVSWKGEGQVKGPVLSQQGAWELCARLADPAQRLNIMKTMDSWVYEGKDATGQEVSPPDACKKLRELFTLHFDIADEAPLPTYKRTPLSEHLAEAAGFPLELCDLVTRNQLTRGINELRLNKGGEIHRQDKTVENLSRLYFGKKGDPKRIIEIPKAIVYKTDAFFDLQAKLEDEYEHHDDDSDHEHTDCANYAPRISCGWPDRVGVLRTGNMVRAELQSWNTCRDLRGGLAHIAIRGIVAIHADY